MDIDKTQALPCKLVGLHKMQKLKLCDDGSDREGLEKRQDILPVLNTAAGELADDEGMAGDIGFFEQRCQF